MCLEDVGLRGREWCASMCRGLVSCAGFSLVWDDGLLWDDG